MIAVLTGPIQTGKTTALHRVFADNPRAGGVLQPVVDGRRHVVCLGSGEGRSLEADAEEAAVRVGRFAFSASALDWARDCVGRALDATDPYSWVVIDEVGPLELGGEGLAPVVRRAAERARQPAAPRTLLVVREGLVGDVCRAFGLGAPLVLRLGDRLPDGPTLARWQP